MELEASKNPGLPLKNWDFPKVHMMTHLFDDIIAKGVTRNYNSKTSESLHGAFRWDYQSGTNFRDVDAQVSQFQDKWGLFLIIGQLLRLNHLKYTVLFIRTKINLLDNMEQSITNDDTGQANNDTDETTESPPPPPTTSTPPIHVRLGSIKKETTVAEFSDGSNGLAYSVFRRMLEDFLNWFYNKHQLPREAYLQVQRDQKVMSNILQLRINY
jgi:hypothetical protein